MDEHLPNIDKLFKSTVDDYEESPPAGVWNGIDKQLDKSNIVSIQKKYAYLKRAVVAVVLLFSVATLFALLTWRPYRQPLQAARSKSYENPAKQKQPAGGAAHLDHQPNQLQLPVSGEDATTDLITKRAEQTDSTNILQSEAPSSIVALRQPHASNAGSFAAQASAKAPVTIIKNQQAKKPAEKMYAPMHSTGNNTGAAALTGNRVSGKNVAMTERSVTPLLTIPSSVVQANPILTTRPLSLRAAMPGIAFVPPADSHSQTVKLTARHHHPFSITLFASPGIAVNRLEADRPKNHEDDKNEIRNGERNKLSFMAGITANLDLGNNFSLQSGLSFSSSTKTIAPKSVYARPDNHGNIQYQYNCSSGYYLIPAKSGSRPTIGDSIGVSGSTSTLQYVSIPLAIKYRFRIGNFSIQPLVGAAVNMLTNEETETPAITWGNAEPHLNNTISGLKPAYLSGLLSVEAEWQLSSRFALHLAPFSRFALTSINKEAAVKTYPAYFGLATGVTIKL